MIDSGIKEVYTWLLSQLYMTFYKRIYNYADFRVVGEFYTYGYPQKFLKIELAFKIAGLKGRVLKAIMHGNDIVIGNFRNGTVVKRYRDRIVMTRLMDALGYKKGDIVIVLAKPFEIRIRRAETELYKLAKRRVIDARKISDYLSIVESYIKHKKREAEHADTADT